MKIVLLVFICVLASCAGRPGTVEQYESSHEDCYRECKIGAPPRTCRYVFTEEMYTAMNSACGTCGEPSGNPDDCKAEQCVAVDGIERTVYTYNRQLPGPALHLCANDILEVVLRVKLPGHGESIHWHGLHQRDTPYMDGVSMVTQCPVLSGESFLYRFKVPEAGTFFYHSHNGLHKVNGAVGPMVVRQPKVLDPHGFRYEHDLAEHSIFLTDWMHVNSEAVFPGLDRRRGQRPSSILINGMGDYQPIDGNRTLTPLAEFNIIRGRRYRFRLVNSGGLLCPIAIQIEKHDMLVIASDSMNVVPERVDTIVTYSGERYDFVVTANHTGGSFWIHAFATGMCADSNLAVSQVAVLSYDRPSNKPTRPRPSAPRPFPIYRILNSPFYECGAKGALCVSDMRAVPPPPTNDITKPADRTILLDVNFHHYNVSKLFNNTSYQSYLRILNAHVAGLINNISYTAPQSPLLSQSEDVKTCDTNNLPPNSSKNLTFCTHVIKVPLGEVVDILMVDTQDVPDPDAVSRLVSHPMHLHGYSFTVLGMGSLSHIRSGQDRLQFAKRMADMGALVHPHSRPPKKDTVLLPTAGFAMIRIRADNPGMWFFHCHFQFHMAAGMELVLQVGEVSDFVPTPKHFPTCGNYLPSS